MRLELRKIEHLKSLSEETPAYTAQLWLDGKHVLDVSNHGHGGCDNQHSPRGNNSDAYALVVKINEWLKANVPPVKSEYFADGLVVDLELWCHLQLDEQDLVKTFKRDLASKVLFQKNDGKVYGIKMKNTDPNRAKMIALVAAKPDTKTILNVLPFDAALALYKQTVVR